MVKAVLAVAGSTNQSPSNKARDSASVPGAPEPGLAASLSSVS